MNRLGTIIASGFCLGLGAVALAVPPDVAWTASYNGPGSYWDAVADATVRDGHLYVVGFTSVSFLTTGYITLKYAPDGSEAWSRVYLGPEPPGPNEGGRAQAVAVDAAGNVYVTGNTTEDSTGVLYADAATLKYSPAGELLWVQRHRGSGGNVQPTAIVHDPDGFLYVCGATWIDGGFDVLLLKYDLDGNLLWRRTRGQPAAAWDSVFAMALAGDGDVVLGGYTQPGDLDVYVLRYGPDGAFRWEWTLHGVANVEEVIDVAVDADGNTYALAQYAPPAMYIGLLTVKLDASGGLLWSDVYSGQSVGDYGAGIELAPDGNIFAAGAAWENGSQNAMTLLRYSPDGQRLWVRSERGGYFSAECNDLAVDAGGAAYMSGYAFDENGEEDYLTAKYDGAGNLVWTAAWDAPERRSDVAYQVRVGLDDRVHVIGDAWRGFDNYYDITSVAYRQDELTAVGETSPGDRADNGRLRLVARPNPTAGETVLAFSLPESDVGSVSIYDPAGRLVRTLRIGRADAGVRSLTWDGRDDRGESVPSGVYLVRLTSRTGVAVGRITRVE